MAPAKRKAPTTKAAPKKKVKASSIMESDAMEIDNEGKSRRIESLELAVKPLNLNQIATST